MPAFSKSTALYDSRKNPRSSLNTCGTTIRTPSNGVLSTRTDNPASHTEVESKLEPRLERRNHLRPQTRPAERFPRPMLAASHKRVYATSRRGGASGRAVNLQLNAVASDVARHNAVSKPDRQQWSVNSSQLKGDTNSAGWSSSR